MSDIFDEYAKIAINQGIVKEASNVGDEEKLRFDSLSNDDICNLYGVKPNGEEKHIVEQAHSKPVYVAPAYDKINGLVENQIERQNIMAWIATKPNDGKHIQERYVKANQDLTMALLNTAFMLDRAGHEDLMKLADSCAHRVVESQFKLKKEAIEPITIALIAGAAVLIGATTSGVTQNYTLTQGILSAAEKANEKLGDMLEDNPTLNANFGRLKKAIVLLMRVGNKVSGLKLENHNVDTDVEKVSEDKEALGKLKASVNDMYDQNAFAVLEYYSRIIDVLTDSLPGYITLLKSEYDKEGAGSWEWARKIWDFVYVTDVPDAIKSLEDLYSSLVEKGVQSVVARKNLLKNFAQKKGDILDRLEAAELKAGEKKEVVNYTSKDKKNKDTPEDKLKSLLSESE